MRNFLLLWLFAAVLNFGLVACSDDDAQGNVPPPAETDPAETPDDSGLTEVELTAGEWMYYGPFGDSAEDIYFLSLKNDSGSEVYYNLGFYINVPTVEYSYDVERIPTGRYVVSNEQRPGHINGDQVARGRSFWWTVDPQMMQHMIVAGELDIACENGVYTITGKIMEDETQGLKIRFKGALPVEDYSEKQWPDLIGDTHASVVLTEGELMYYGPFEQSQEAVYYLYLKHRSSDDLSYFMGFYVNVNKADKQNLVLTPGKYVSASSWAVGTFTDCEASKKSFWYTVDAQGLQLTHYVKSGEFEVAYAGGVYTISGTLCEEDEAGTLRTLDIAFEGKLPAEDYSDPDPDPTPAVDPVTLTVGELAYYGVESGVDVYYLNLKDQKPMKDYDLTLYLCLPAEAGRLCLETGDYEADGSACKAWGIGSAKPYPSFWNTIDPLYGDRVKNMVTGGTVRVERSGAHYRIEGALTGAESSDEVSVSFVFDGELACDDWS